MNLSNAAPLGIAVLGLLLGMRHATDPDHVIAVTTILASERRFLTAARIGCFWGMGHSATVLAVGAAIVLLKIQIPVWLGLAMEFSVAIVLIALGWSSTKNLVKTVLARFGLRRRVLSIGMSSHSHRHGYGVGEHVHPHVLASGNGDSITGSSLHREFSHDHIAQAQPLAAYRLRRPLAMSFGVGLVHGLAGSAAIALLVLASIPDPRWAVAYLFVFCIGTIIGMCIVTATISAPFVFASSRVAGVHRFMVAGSGLLSFGFGLIMALHIGIANHLIAGAQTWSSN